MGGKYCSNASMKGGDLWRVQIPWPNGTKRYFGKFGSEQEAERWISRHRWLTGRGMEGTKIYRPWGSVRQRKYVATGQAEGGEPVPEQQGKD
jgi:hypothetical protein